MTKTQTPGDSTPALWSRLVVGAAVAVVLACGAWMWFDGMVRTPGCTPREGGRLSLSELVDLNDKVRGHFDSTEPLVLEPKELAFLFRLAEVEEVDVALGAQDVHLQLGLPAVSGCYDVDLHAVVTVHQGVVLVSPVRLAVGMLDVTPWVGGQDWRIGPEGVRGVQGSEVLAFIESMAVEDGQVVAQVDRSFSLE